jgi:methanogenic corrinoid protein MtbC1
VTAQFLARHPDWLTRYGDLARVRGVEDALFHVDFLAGAIETGNTRAFEEYARWTAGVLRSRGIGPSFLAENLAQVADAAAARLEADDAALVAAFVQAGRAAALVDPAPEDRVEPLEGLALTRQIFVQAILLSQRQAATNVILEALRDDHDVADIYVEVFQAALYEIGRRWEANQISVAQEHMATAIVQYVLAQLYPRIVPAAVARGRMVITGVQGELHQVGAHMVADMLETDGWDVRFLGTNLPSAGVLQALDEHSADVLGISTTMLFNLPHVRRLIDDARARSADRPLRIVLGGGAFRSAPGLWRELGADGFATDLREAVTIARGWSKVSA